MGTCSSKAVVSQLYLFQLCASKYLTGHLLVYISALALVGVVFLMVMRCFEKWEVLMARRVGRGDEREPLWSEKSRRVSTTYGTSGGGDVERGDCSEELSVGKLCVICFDQDRSCFFVPCGHCATCHLCALRIYRGENMTCPICRRTIRKVRKLFAP